MGLPLDDWQFWIVTAIAVLGCWLVLKPLFARAGRPETGCANCTFGAASVNQRPASPLVQLGSGRPR